jgi:hypothetical protein
MLFKWIQIPIPKFQGFRYKGLGFEEVSNSMVSEASDVKGLGVLGHGS